MHLMPQQAMPMSVAAIALLLGMASRIAAQDLFMAPRAQSKVAAAAPKLAYWHSYVAKDGLVYFAQCNYSNFSSSSVGPGVVPSWHEILPLGDGLVPLVSQFPIGHEAPWHVDPKVQLIQVLSGKMEWELSGGQKHIFLPGELYMEEDHLADNTTGKLGHVTRNVGDTEAAFLMLQTRLTPTREKPCRFS